MKIKYKIFENFHYKCVRLFIIIMCESTLLMYLFIYFAVIYEIVDVILKAADKAGNKIMCQMRYKRFSENSISIDHRDRRELTYFYEHTDIETRLTHPMRIIYIIMIIVVIAFIGKQWQSNRSLQQKVTSI